MNQIVLIGFMGAGKTTVGNLLAEKMGCPQYDFDQLIVDKIGMSIAEYFDQYGDAAFRDIETAVLAEVDTLEGVLSTGGGIVLKDKNRTLLKKMPYVVYLKADLSELIQRVTHDEENVRPLADSKTPAEIEAIYRPRVPLYEESARIIIETTGKTPEEIVTEILKQVGE